MAKMKSPQTMDLAVLIKKFREQPKQRFLADFLEYVQGLHAGTDRPVTLLSDLPRDAWMSYAKSALEEGLITTEQASNAALFVGTHKISPTAPDVVTAAEPEVVNPPKSKLGEAIRKRKAVEATGLPPETPVIPAKASSSPGGPGDFAEGLGPSWEEDYDLGAKELRRRRAMEAASAPRSWTGSPPRQVFPSRKVNNVMRRTVGTASEMPPNLLGMTAGATLRESDDLRKMLGGGAKAGDATKDMLNPMDAKAGWLSKVFGKTWGQRLVRGGGLLGGALLVDEAIRKVAPYAEQREREDQLKGYELQMKIQASRELHDATMKRLLEDRVRILETTDPDVLRSMRRLPELTSSETLVNAKPDDANVVNVLAQAIRKTGAGQAWLGE